MAARVYLTVAEAKQIHDQLIAEFGGAPGILDRGRLEAAMFRAQSGYYGSLSEEAAALMESLANNNPFVDGNKRTAFAVTDTFLRLNGFQLNADPNGAKTFIVTGIETGQFKFDSICHWIELHIDAIEE